MRKGSRGFTLVELMIVASIIGILSAIALPKFAALIRKSKEGASKGNLGALRSSLNIYYGDMEGQFPSSLSGLTVAGKYIAVIPLARTPNYHPDTSTETDAALGNSSDTGQWIYDNVSTDANVGQVSVNCSDTDTKGNRWTTY